MKKQAAAWEWDGFLLRLAEMEDAQPYYQDNFCPLDEEVVRFTGCKPIFSSEEVISFFQSCVDDPDRYDFLVLNPEGRIVGEGVLNEIDWNLRKANFRIALFSKEVRNRGLGTWVTKCLRDFAFRKLQLHRLELEVYSFNPRGRRVYEKAGFHREGVLCDAIKDGDGYADVILMAMLEKDWQTIRTENGEEKHG